MLTPLSTSTGPKLFLMSLSSMIGVSTSILASCHPGGVPLARRFGRARLARERWPCAPAVRMATATDCGKAPSGLLDAVLLARGGDRSGADLRDLGVPVVEHLLHVLGRDDDRRLRKERRAVGRLVREGRLLTVDQLHRQVHRGLRLQLERLVNRRDLLAEQDVLQPGRARVLAADRDLLAVL